MKDASGASQMDAKTQVTQPAWRADAATRRTHSLEGKLCLALLHEPGGENDAKLINVAVAAEINLHGDAGARAAQAARDAGNAPNSVLAAAAASSARAVQTARARPRDALIDRIRHGGRLARRARRGLRRRAERRCRDASTASSPKPANRAPRRCSRASRARGAKSVFVR